MIGADIEFFLRNNDTGKIVPACGMIGANKEAPKKINDTYSILEDGAAVELNYQPQNRSDNWQTVINRSFTIISQNIPGYAVAQVSEAWFDDIKKYPQAMEIGCLPDFDAYGKSPDKPRKIPNIKKFGKFRFAGLHVHLSYTSKERFPPWAVARLMDVFVLLPTFMQFNRDQVEQLLGPRRREFYGMPGLHRPKDYGMEYRVFSTGLLFNQVALATTSNLVGYFHQYLNDAATADKLERVFTQVNWKEVQEAVKTLNINKAAEIYNGAYRQLAGF